MKRSLELYILAITVSLTPSYSLTLIPVPYKMIIIIITEQTANFYALYDILLIENIALTVNNRALST
jgi:hypothetical protein